MSVINKKEFFLLWTKQSIKNLHAKFESAFTNNLARDILKNNQEYLAVSKFIQVHGDQKVTSQLLTNPTFMLDFLTVINSKEFYPLEVMSLGQLPPDKLAGFVDDHLDQPNRLILSNRSGPGQSSENEEVFADEEALEEWKNEQLYMHVLNLVKAFFKKRMLNGKNLFKVLAKQFTYEDSRWKVFELIFIIAFFCKDLPSDLDFYHKSETPLNIFNNSFNNLAKECNPMLTKCIFQVIGESLRQFTLFEEDASCQFMGLEQAFMKKAHKINLNESFLDKKTNESFGSRKQSFAKGVRNGQMPICQSKIGTAPYTQQSSQHNQNGNDDEKVLTTQVSTTHWKDLSLDTFNLSPKSSAKPSPSLATDQEPKHFKFLNTIKSLQEEEDKAIRIEELENELFMLKNEKLALQKNIEILENELVKGRESEEVLVNEKDEYLGLVRNLEQDVKEFEVKLSIVNREKELFEAQLVSQKELSDTLNQFKHEATELKQENLVLQKENIFLHQRLRESEQLQQQQHLEVQALQSQLDTSHGFCGDMGSNMQSEAEEARRQPVVRMSYQFMDQGYQTQRVTHRHSLQKELAPLISNPFPQVLSVDFSCQIQPSDLGVVCEHQKSAKKMEEKLLEKVAVLRKQVKEGKIEAQIVCQKYERKKEKARKLGEQRREMKEKMEESEMCLDKTFVRKEKKKKEAGMLKEQLEYYEEKYQGMKKVNKYLEKKIKKLKGWKISDIFFLCLLILLLLSAFIAALVIII